MDHRAFESSALARKVLPMSPASLIYNDENGIHLFIYIYILSSHDNVIAKAITLLISVAVARTVIFQKKDHNDIHHKDNDTNTIYKAP
jgi:hypothetical protein